MDIAKLSKGRFSSTIVWAFVISAIVVSLTAGLGRAALNLRGAVSDNPDLAIYVLLPEEEIGQTELLREEEGERAYLAATKDGPKLIRLALKNGKWAVVEVEALRE